METLIYVQVTTTTSQLSSKEGNLKPGIQEELCQRIMFLLIYSATKSSIWSKSHGILLPNTKLLAQKLFISYYFIFSYPLCICIYMHTYIKHIYVILLATICIILATVYIINMAANIY